MYYPHFKDFIRQSILPIPSRKKQELIYCSSSSLKYGFEQDIYCLLGKSDDDTVIFTVHKCKVYDQGRRLCVEYEYGVFSIKQLQENIKIFEKAPSSSSKESIEYYNRLINEASKYIVLAEDYNAGS